MPSSILTSSLGVASSKDTFWTTSDQPNPQSMVLLIHYFHHSSSSFALVSLFLFLRLYSSVNLDMGCYGLGLKNHNNTNVELHTVLVSLTDGPVGFSDALGYALFIFFSLLPSPFSLLLLPPTPRFP